MKKLNIFLLSAAFILCGMSNVSLLGSEEPSSAEEIPGYVYIGNPSEMSPDEFIGKIMGAVAEMECCSEQARSDGNQEKANRLKDLAKDIWRIINESVMD